ncbi:oligosaccharide flippase family protein, partial [Enterococcus faecium]|nr:oligosaccharide flippase family protein [Enterococcus faecium]
MENFKKNSIYAISSQLSGLFLSFFIALIIPKFLGVIEFSYWQLFLFYVNYLGLLHFGLNDGIYLKYGGQRREELPLQQLAKQFTILTISQFFIMIIVLLLSFFIENAQRKTIWIAVALYLPLVNINGFIGYLLQSINEIYLYSISVIIDKIIIIVGVLSLIFFNYRDFAIYIYVYVFSKLISTLYLYNRSRKVTRFNFNIHLSDWKETKILISSGIKLMFANIMGTLILGLNRKLVDIFWGIEAFGRFSFAISLTNFFLLFISQVSIVIFPALRRINKEKLKNIFTFGNIILNRILLGGLLLYLPVSIFLKHWLPAYTLSIDYLCYLLPIFIFDGKMQIINNTFFKVLRKEKEMLLINILALTISGILGIIVAFSSRNMNLMILILVISIGFRSLIAELYFKNMFDQGSLDEMIWLYVLILTFTLSNLYIGNVWGSVIY